MFAYKKWYQKAIFTAKKDENEIVSITSTDNEVSAKEELL